jgi:hypothetical protein
MDMLALETMVVIEPTGIDQSDVTLAVAGDDLLATSAYFLCKLGQPRADLIQRNDVLRSDRHDYELCRPIH